jgi:heme O synthase-like polyprenyltransferase
MVLAVRFANFGGHPSLPQLLVSAFGWLRRCRRVQLLVEQHIDADASNCLATYCAVNSATSRLFACFSTQPYVRQVRWLLAGEILTMWQPLPPLWGYAVIYTVILRNASEYRDRWCVRGDAAGAGLGCNDGHSRTRGTDSFSLLWTPPFLAPVVSRRRLPQSPGLPMLPVTRQQVTRLQIFLYTLILFAPV